MANKWSYDTSNTSQLGSAGAELTLADSDLTDVARVLVWVPPSLTPAVIKISPVLGSALTVSLPAGQLVLLPWLIKRVWLTGTTSGVVAYSVI